LPDLLTQPPVTRVDPVTEVIHGVAVVDPYRWLEDSDSRDTREWIEQQSAFARGYLDEISGRNQIERRIRECLEIETCDSVLVAGGHYVFRKRLPREEQPSIYARKGPDGPDRLLINPADRAAGKYIAVNPLAISPDGKILAYEVKEGGERTSCLEFVDLTTGNRLPESLPRGYLRAFAFGPDSRSIYYSVEPVDQSEPFSHVVYQHALGQDLKEDQIVFNAGNANNLRIGLISGPMSQLIFVQRLLDRIIIDCYLRTYTSNVPARHILQSIDYVFAPQFIGNRILALTNLNAPNLRVVELRLHPNGSHDLVELVPSRPALIQQWLVLREYMVVSYVQGTSFKVCVFDHFGKPLREMPILEDSTIRLVPCSGDANEFMFTCESFFESQSIHRYSITRGQQSTWSKPGISLDRSVYGQRQIWYRSKDGTRIPMFLVGRQDLLEAKYNPVILTSYGGFQTSMTPQFSVFVAFLMEKGCLFALPNIRGGGEFGAQWHVAAQRHERQTAFDDFISATHWLIDNGVAAHDKVAAFGGSNSGLLVAAAMAQAPSLFRAVVCIAPLLDMIRYHLFNGAAKWKEEFGTAESPDDFAALWRYSPYHRISDNVSYPAVMMISGDADQKCHPLHARKMIARLQAANCSTHPSILDYSNHRGHVSVLPLSIRVEALTDRMAFLCDQLNLER
jgi:prolyl oligopeptidase